MDAMKKQELWLYTFVWMVVFALVPLSLFVHLISGHDNSIGWVDILPIWGSILPYLVLFLLHNHLAAPLLQQKKLVPYLLVALTLLAAFILYCAYSPSGPPDRGGPGMPADWDMGMRSAPPDGRRPVDPRVMKVVIGLLVVLVNLGVKAVFMNLRSEQKMRDLQAQSLSQQLETLRYQISPHFFMNTLNNIHALVDIEPEKAKESIEEFSKLMRIVLYEGDAPTIPLRQEVEFLQHYVALMRLRYPDDVDIELRLPEKLDDVQVPPLIMATFVENAFKHGISYQETSFVHVKVATEKDKILFKCVNSRHFSAQKGQHGLGLENLRRRLDLLYGDRYTLHVEEGESVYEVILLIPVL